MLFAALRDMQWKKRRLIITVVSTALIFGMTLVMTGLMNGFRVEAQNTVDSMGVDAFVVKNGAAGPFMGSTPFPDVDLARIAALPGVTAAAPLACVGTIMKEGGSTRKRHGLRRARAWARHAASLGGSGAVDAGRGRGVERAGPTGLPDQHRQ